MWDRIGAALVERSPAHDNPAKLIRSRRITSHLDAGEDSQYGLTIQARLGNLLADALASAAALAHDTPKSQMHCYDRVRATLALVWLCIVRASMGACARDGHCLASEHMQAKEAEKAGSKWPP